MDMRQTIVPKSDQLNADDLIAGPMTIKVTEVKIKGGPEQPVSIHFEGDKGKPYKPCKSMCRVMVAAWGADSSKYVGRSMTLYCDPKVKWAGMEVGGIRISHMTDIPESMTMALTVTRANKKPYTVKPLASGAATKPAAAPDPAPAADTITPAQHKRLEARIKELGADRDKLKAYVSEKFGIEHLNALTKEAYKAVDAMLDKKAAKAAEVAEPTISDKIAACQTVDELDALAETLSEDDAAIFFDAFAKRKSELQEGGL